MHNSIYVLLSAFLGLILINFTIIVNARTCSKGWIGKLPVEARYVVFLLLILLLVLNANQWIAGDLLFPLLAISGLVALTISSKKLKYCDRRGALLDAVSILAVQIITLLLIFTAYQMQNYWLLEARNHDSLVYYQGLHWANESALFVGKEAIRARWNLGVCGEGLGWVGYDCPLYRGGTYTLAAWVQYFAPDNTGNGLYFIANYAATLVWFAIRLLPGTIMGRSLTLINGLLVLVVALSPGLIGALANSNLATVMAGGAIALIIAIALRTDLRPKVRYGLMALGCAVCSHIYAESVFYAGLIICLLFVLELRILIRTLTFVGVLRLAMFLAFLVLVMSNISLVQAFSNLLFLGEVAKGGEWFSWYIDQIPVLWIGSFIVGLLMGSFVSTSMAILATFITISAVIFLLYSRQTRSGILSLIIISLLAIVYVEVTGYQYGEHKVVHLLGPAWTLMIVAVILKLIRSGNGSRKLQSYVRKILASCFFFSLAFFLVSFLLKAFSQLDNLRGPHGIDFGLTTLASYVQPDDNVILEDSAWLGVEKFHKAHYLIFQLHNRGAEVFMPDISSDKLRGGYFWSNRNDTLSSAENIDWLVQSRSYSIKNSKFHLMHGAPIWENEDYSLYSVDEDPLAVASNGWHDCEISHCWTSAPFEIETYVPKTGQFELSINFAFFRPPEEGTITVSTSDGRLLAIASSSSDQLRVELPQGWSRLVFENNWPVSSPQDVGISEDSRKLFAAIQSVEIIPLQEYEAE